MLFSMILLISCIYLHTTETGSVSSLKESGQNYLFGESLSLSSLIKAIAKSVILDSFT